MVDAGLMPGDTLVVNVKIIEIDAERRRLSLSLRRVEPGEPVKTIVGFRVTS